MAEISYNGRWSVNELQLVVDPPRYPRLPGISVEVIEEKLYDDVALGRDLKCGSRF